MSSQTSFLIRSISLVIRLLLCSLFAFQNLGTFVIWNCRTAVPLDASNLDPNYLLQSQFASSPWHQALLGWQHLHSGQPLLHIDVHGKVDRKTELNLDVGIEPMNQHWPYQVQVTTACSECLLAVCCCTALHCTTYFTTLHASICGPTLFLSVLVGGAEGIACAHKAGV